MTQNKGLICDIETGICGEPESDDSLEVIDFNTKEKVDLYYVTDPICSHCWALEPVLRRFTEQYGEYFNFHTLMGGLLEKWDGFADVSNGIGQPSDVAEHWREVGEATRMPIDGSVWTKDPVHSSYPPSRVFKVIQELDKELSSVFLRRVREAVFVENKNIAKEDFLIDVVNKLGLDGSEIVKKAFSVSGEKLLNDDFEMVSKLGVRGFPTIIMMNKENKGVKIVGARQFESYVEALRQVTPEKDVKPKVPLSLDKLIQKEKMLFSKEIEVFYNIEPAKFDEFVSEELSGFDYDVKEILGEKYIVTK